MSQTTDATHGSERGTGRLGFLDPLAKLFRRKEAAAGASPAKQEPAASFGKIEAEFERVVQQLNEKVEEQRRASASSGPRRSAAKQTADERAADRVRRIEACHSAMREDIVKMHAQLGTGLSAEDLDQIAAFLEELETATAEGKQSHSLLPRARHAIAEKLRIETGELAVARLVERVQREGGTWPDPTRHRDSATAEEIERSRRRRLAETRETFLANGFGKTAERMLGNIRGWGSDYPDRGSPLWEECVLEGVAAGIRGQLLREFVELLRRDRDPLLAQIEQAVGKEVEALQGVLEGGVHSLDQATAAVASALRVVDEMAPEIAWQHLRSSHPKAAGAAAG